MLNRYTGLKKLQNKIIHAPPIKITSCINIFQMKLIIHYTEERKQTYCSPSILYVFHVGRSRYFTRGIDDRTTRIKAFHATKQKAKIPEDFTDCSNSGTRYNVEMSIGLKRMWKDSEKIRFPAYYSRKKPRLTKSASEVSPNAWIYEHAGEYREKLCAALWRTRNWRFLWEKKFFFNKKNLLLISHLIRNYCVGN